jgi:hypothetical protein
MNDNNILLAVIFVFGLVFGFVFGFAITSDHWRQEIINKGFAEWHLVDGTRETEFKWKEKQ